MTPDLALGLAAMDRKELKNRRGKGMMTFDFIHLPGDLFRSQSGSSPE
jgi:hypothetical protein